MEKESSIAASAALSMVNTVKDNILTRQVAILAADGVNEVSLLAMKDALQAAGAVVEIIAPCQGYIISEGDVRIPVDKSFLTGASVFYDAVYVPGGTNSVATLEGEPDAIHFLNEAFKHCKAIAADEQAIQVLKVTYFGRKLPEDFSEENVLEEGLAINNDTAQLAEHFIKAIAQHRFWNREKPRKVPA